jgi:RNA polymerase sigma-70 factor (ECF subfamily)
LTDQLDEQLARARMGDRAAFAHLVRAHQRSVYSLALRMLSDQEAARDLTQDVFLQLHFKLMHIESSAHLGFWLRKVVSHRAIDRLREKPPVDLATPEEIDVLSGGTEASADGEEDPLFQRELRRLIQELPPAPRAVMLLRYQEDLDPIDIARTLDMPINTVKSHLKRALATLRSRLCASLSTPYGAR